MAYTRTYDIPYFLVDRNRKLRVTHLIQFLEDMAIRHSEHCGVGLDFYEQNNVAWVLAKWDVTIHAYPTFNQEITILTEPTSFRNFFGFRRFEVRSSDETLLAEGYSLWIFVDTHKKKPQPVSDELIAAYGLKKSQNKPLPIKAPERPSKPDLRMTFSIRPGDIDTNSHVNNARYIEWALDILPLEKTDGLYPARIRVDYKKELILGEDVSSTAEICHTETGITTRHQFGSGEKTACIIAFDWKK